MPFRGTVAAAILIPFIGSGAIADQPGSHLATTSAATSQVAATGHLSAKEKEALAFRHLQTELMVAALSCGRKEFRAKYNTFVIRYRPALRRNGNTLRAIFKRNYGRQGKRRLDAYVTRLANEASVRSMQQSGFCEVARRKFDAVLGASSTATAGGLLQRAQNQ
ncbi:MAG: hypothetical protein R3229_13565 [Alphaproteobacteria bacterium]|nr:hypothetical protein [Alphaproteobacteria bacterium]